VPKGSFRLVEGLFQIEDIYYMSFYVLFTRRAKKRSGSFSSMNESDYPLKVVILFWLIALAKEPSQCKPWQDQPTPLLSLKKSFFLSLSGNIGIPVRASLIFLATKGTHASGGVLLLARNSISKTLHCQRYKAINKECTGMRTIWLQTSPFSRKSGWAPVRSIDRPWDPGILKSLKVNVRRS